jgi:hypothetical protein
MKIKIIKNGSGAIYASDLECGEVGRVSNPSLVWGKDCSFLVEVLPPGTRLEITL